MKKLFIKSLALILILLGAPIALAQSTDARLELVASSLNPAAGEEFTVDVMLKNPGLQKVISVRSWLTYDAGSLDAISINSQESPFAMTAPGEDNIAKEEGRVKIGRSNITGGVAGAEALVARVTFRAKDKGGVTEITPYDYQVSELGHVSANIIEQGFPLNILAAAPESVKITLAGGAAAQPPAAQPIEPARQEAPVGGNDYLAGAALLRPLNLKVNTGPGYVDLKWDSAAEPGRLGFNVYYGRTSGGLYSRRRTLDNVNSTRIDGLNNNDTFYFAVTAYDQYNRESDYSNEVGIIVNQPLSATHPFEGMLSGMLGMIPSQPQNGPLMNWLLISAFGLTATVFLRSKRPAKLSKI